MSKDTYSDDKKIESFKSLEIASGQNTTASNGNLTLSTSNQNDVILFLGLGYADPERCYESNYDGSTPSALGNLKPNIRASYTDICVWK